MRMVNWRKLSLQAFLIAFGEVPHPAASVRSLETAVKTALVRISNGTESDPEVPDGLLQVLLPALKARGLTDESVVTVVESVNSLISSPGGAAVAPGWSGVVTPPGKDPEDAESILSQIGKGLLHGAGASFGIHQPLASADVIAGRAGTIMNIIGGLLG